MNALIESLRGKLIVSCQAYPAETNDRGISGPSRYLRGARAHARASRSCDCCRSARSRRRYCDYPSHYDHNLVP